MEGGGRRGAWLLGAVLACATLAFPGCGSSSESDAIETNDPEATFAPLVLLDRAERWRPMGARWFIDRAVLWFAEDEGCEDRKIAVGRTLKAQQNPVTDWIYTSGLGRGGGAYFRTPYDERCELKRSEGDFDYRYYASQRTRPLDTVDRPDRLAPGEGFYLDLIDGARRGEPFSEREDLAFVEVPVYAERRAEKAGDQPELRLTYWLLFGMNDPPDASELRHEGDWERVDVVLRRGEEDDRYKPVSLSLQEDGMRRDVPWERVKTSEGNASSSSTHPVLAAAGGSHGLYLGRAGCDDCPRWETWRKVIDAQRRFWYGFGGAWGEPGSTALTTGPLGPHGKWFDPAVGE